MFFCETCHGTTGHRSYCPNYALSAPLQPWERELLNGTAAQREGEGDVTFIRTDGREVTIRDVRVESVGPSAEVPGVIGVEFFDNDNVVHVPFVESWTFSYRL